VESTYRLEWGRDSATQYSGIQRLKAFAFGDVRIVVTPGCVGEERRQLQRIGDGPETRESRK
jgi:hypothetical protein